MPVATYAVLRAQLQREPYGGGAGREQVVNLQKEGTGRRRSRPCVSFPWNNTNIEQFFYLCESVRFLFFLAISEEHVSTILEIVFFFAVALALCAVCMVSQ